MAERKTPRVQNPLTGQGTALGPRSCRGDPKTCSETNMLRRGLLKKEGPARFRETGSPTDLRIPLATYRLQLRPDFNFEAAVSVVNYLRELGISHVYCSPYLQAAPGSTHGYDTVDYHRVSAELGGEEGRTQFTQKLRECGLGQVLDIVPNHMAITGHYNRWWWDTLENGEASRYAPYFDIEWDPPEERLRHKILLPVLGDHYGRVLAAGEITLERQDGHFIVRYHEHTFPVAPESIAELLSKAADRGRSSHLGFLADSLRELQRSADGGWTSLLIHDRDKEAIRELLARLCSEQPNIAQRVDDVIKETNNNIDELDAVLSRQCYRLSRWRTAESELVYRRFFDINTLVGIRAENERVFADTHCLILQWLQNGQLSGLRVDHPDGLRDPGQYFERLRAAAPDAWIVAEKILAPGEHLPNSWNIAGTTGYDFLNLAGGLFVDPRGEAAMNECYREFTHAAVDFSIVVREGKALTLRELLGSDINRLTALFLDICENNRDYRDYTRHEIHEAIRETAASFSVYRTYIGADAKSVSESDVEYINQAVSAAKAARPELEERLFDFLRDVLLLRVPGNREQEFAMRFQQVTVAAMAKGVEDTAFYRHARLISLNEVGSDPSRFGVAVDDFHKWCADTQARYPSTMLATSTHDTKRSEDARIRIGLLSENPGAWTEVVNRWAVANARYRSGEFPDRKTEYFLYQTLVGVWPISKERLVEYMRKVIREAKENTSWITPNSAYESAVEHFCESLLGDPEFTASLDRFVSQILPVAHATSLSLTLLKLTAPGVPDIYQGTELWDLSLVDPDNRRPVNYELRKHLLAELDHLTPEELLNRSEEGLPKLWVIRQTLRARCSHMQDFGAKGAYTALWATGAKASHLVSFQRGENIITIAPRLFLTLGDWEGASLEIPEGVWKNQFTGDLIHGGKVEVASLISRFPVALLTKEAMA
jgi:(1->4)-alpha-D-glucan 1-alpha-D-glucosylmutase